MSGAGTQLTQEQAEVLRKRRASAKGTSPEYLHTKGVHTAAKDTNPVGVCGGCTACVWRKTRISRHLRHRLMVRACDSPLGALFDEHFYIFCPRRPACRCLLPRLRGAAHSQILLGQPYPCVRKHSKVARIPQPQACNSSIFGPSMYMLPLKRCVLPSTQR